MEFEKRERNMSQAQINRHKKVGAELTRTTSIIGLGSLAALGTTAAAPKLARAGKLGSVSEKGAKKFHAATKNKLVTAGILSQGVGGLNGLNNAAWQDAESRQRKKAVPVAKNYYGGIELDGMFGEFSKSVRDEEIEKALAMPKAPGMPKLGQLKALPQQAKNVAGGFKHGLQTGRPAPAPLGHNFMSGANAGAKVKNNPAVQQAHSFIGANKKPLIQGAVTGAVGGAVGGAMMNNKPKQPKQPGQFGKAYYDPEERRMKRADNYERGADVAAGAAGIGALHQGRKAYKQGKKVKSGDYLPEHDVKGNLDRLRVDSKANVSVPKSIKAVPLENFRGAARSGGKATALAAAGAGAVYAGRKINEKKNTSWQPYVSKSGASPFGVIHD